MQTSVDKLKDAMLYKSAFSIIVFGVTLNRIRIAFPGVIIVELQLESNSLNEEFHRPLTDHILYKWHNGYIKLGNSIIPSSSSAFRHRWY